MNFSDYKSTLKQIDYYIYALCEIVDGERKPFYIGKGKGNRCLNHLDEIGDSEKQKQIQRLLKQERLGIDILRHGIKTDAAAKLIEATCIDLLGVGELTNVVRGSGTAMGRMPLEEIHHLKSGNYVEISKEHSGIAFILNKTYKSGMSPLALFEATRGMWHNVPRDDSRKYAYAVYGGIIKEVYTIHSWVRAGTQAAFTRKPTGDISRRWEFVGCIAPDEVRKLYVGNLLKTERSYGAPFVKVG